MTLDPGKLDRRVTIMTAAKDDDGFSSEPGVPAEVGKRWMSRVDVSDGERMRAESFGAKITSRFVCHYDSITATIRAETFSLVCEGLTYNVTGVKEIGRCEGLEITTASDLAQS
jgi:head-tail adaptor